MRGRKLADTGKLAARLQGFTIQVPVLTGTSLCCCRNPPGFGFITFADDRDADDACAALDGKNGWKVGCGQPLCNHCAAPLSLSLRVLHHVHTLTPLLSFLSG